MITGSEYTQGYARKIQLGACRNERVLFVSMETVDFLFIYCILYHLPCSYFFLFFYLKICFLSLSYIYTFRFHTIQCISFYHAIFAFRSYAFCDIRRDVSYRPTSTPSKLFRVVVVRRLLFFLFSLFSIFSSYICLK